VNTRYRSSVGVTLLVRRLEVREQQDRKPKKDLENLRKNALRKL